MLSPFAEMPTMNAKHGFALVTYRDADQIHDLISVLNEMFDCPPISIHHDFKQSDLQISSFQSNVQLIPKHFKTGWGTLSTLYAMTETMLHLSERNDAPEWFHLITGHCYPIKPASYFDSFFSSCDADVFICHSLLYPIQSPDQWQKEMLQRYIDPFIRFPFITRSGKLMYKYLQLPKHFKRQPPFDASYPCWTGHTYYSCNQKGIHALVEGMSNTKMINWFIKRQIVDEAIPATIFANSGLRVSSNDLRYVKWLNPKEFPGEPNPKTLKEEDFEDIIKSDALFARKLLPGRSDNLRHWLRKEIMHIQSKTCLHGSVCILKTLPSNIHSNERRI